MQNIRILCLLLIIAYSVAHQTRQYRDDLDGMFSLEDTNSDGVISYEEFVEAYEEYKSLGIETRTPEENLELFRSLDTNDDNQLDRAEYDAMEAK